MRYAVVLAALASTALGRHHHYNWKHHHGNGTLLSYLTTGTGGVSCTGGVGSLSPIVPFTVTSTVTVRQTSTVGASELPSSGLCSDATVSVTVTPTITVTAGQGSSSFTLASSVSLPSEPTTAVSSQVASSPVSTETPTPVPTSSSISVSVVVPASSSSTSTAVDVPSSTTAAATTEASSSSTPVETPTPSTVASTTETPATTATTISSSTAAGGTAGTASTASASAVPSASGTPQLTSKRGILATAGKDQEALTVAFTNSPKISWLCNWYSAPPPNEAPHIQFVPQLYGPGESADNYKGWNTNARQAIGRDEKFFLSFGEPVDTLTPQQAVSLFMQEMQPYAAQGVALGSPSVLQPRPDMDWLAAFLPLCEQAGCSISFVAVHWFDHTSADKPGFPEFKGAVENATALAKGKPVWVDNFQANGTDADVRAFFDEAIPYLEGNAAVARYAYVSPMRTEPAAGFLNQDGSLSDLGAYYADYAS